MAASHAALFGLTGSPVIGVFHAASDGKDGQDVPGMIGPVAAAEPDANDTVDRSPTTSAPTATSTVEKWSAR